MTGFIGAILILVNDSFFLVSCPSARVPRAIAFCGNVRRTGFLNPSARFSEAVQSAGTVRDTRL
jgi:hypothetical protein